MINITAEMLRHYCLISDEWISNRVFMIHKSLVRNAALFSTVEVAKAAFPNLDVNQLSSEGILPKNRVKYTITNWIYNNSGDDLCLFIDEEKSGVYVSRRYYESVLKHFGLYYMFGATHSGCMVLTDKRADAEVKLIIVGSTRNRDFPIINYGAIDQLLGGSRKLDL